MARFRMERVNKELQREISMLLEFVIKDETAKKAVITGVDCSRDLKIAKVYFTTLTSEDRGAVLKSLKKAGTFLRTSLAKKLTIRTVPELNFVYDRSGDYGRSIDRLLDMAMMGDSGEEGKDHDL